MSVYCLTLIVIVMQNCNLVYFFFKITKNVETARVDDLLMNLLCGQCDLDYWV